jgi:hypothetical protein
LEAGDRGLDDVADGTGRNQYPSESGYKINGATLVCSRTCSSPSDFSERYTASNQQILFIRGPFDGSCDKGVTLVLTYDKQP